jgi:hypothetical protein
MSVITVGADPELFLFSSKTKQFVSAHGKFPGTKTQPFNVKKGAVQVDGTALEFNIHPASTVEEFLSNVESVTSVLKLMVKRADPSLQLTVVPTAVYDRAYFDTLPEEAKLLGCEPDYNAYTEVANVPPETNESFRTGSGHIHVGWTEFQSPFDSPHYFDCLTVTKQLDAGLFIPSLLWDDDDKRRSLYGKIGAFRPKSYGVEYRPLSNRWVSDPDIGSWIFRTVKHSMKLLEQKEELFSNGYIEGHIKRIQKDVKPIREEVLKYYYALLHQWGFPELPEEYAA